MTIKMKIDAITDSKRVMTTIFLPLFFKLDNIKYSPTLKAIKAKAISVTKSILEMTSLGTNFKQ